MYGTAVIFFITEILFLRSLLVFRDMDRMVHQFIHSFILCGRDRNDRNAQLTFHLVDIDASAVTGDFIHHIQGDDHRDPHLQQLHAQIEVAFDIHRIDDIDDGLRLILKDEIAGNDLFRRIRRHRIDARKVRDQSIGMSLDDAVLAVDRNARKVSDVLVGTGQLIEQGRLAAVLVSDQRKGNPAFSAFSSISCSTVWIQRCTEPP